MLREVYIDEFCSSLTKQEIPNAIKRRAGKMSWRTKAMITKHHKEIGEPFSHLLGFGAIDDTSASALYIITRLLKPETVIETGTGWGRSATIILQALEDNRYGKLVSFDPGSGRVTNGIGATRIWWDDKEPGFIIPKHLRKRFVLIREPSMPYLRSLASAILPQLFLHDSIHEYENQFLEISNALRYMAKGIILVHDWYRSLALEEICNDAELPLLILLPERYMGATVIE